MDKELYKELLKEFGGALVEVRDVAKKYYGMGNRAADAACSGNDFNFTVFKAGTQRSKCLARSADVAKDLATKKNKIDKQREFLVD